MKAFLITVDTEGDNLWDWKKGKKITTENAKYLKRFQVLCEKYGLYPTYFTNYEMAEDPVFTEFAEAALSRDACEIGMHLHAWNNPPIVELPNADNKGGQPYLIEYPADFMEEKIALLSDLLRKKFGPVVSHRAGRWATDDTYFSLLEKYGYTIDCSVTPGLNWSGNKGGTIGSKGSDYTQSNKKPYIIKNTNIVEIPVSIFKSHKLPTQEFHGIKRLLKDSYHAMKGHNVWVRPTHGNTYEMFDALRLARKNDSQYLMFVIHSSELMPGGSPNFKTSDDIENLYRGLDTFFSCCCETFSGITVAKYCKQLNI